MCLLPRRNLYCKNKNKMAMVEYAESQRSILYKNCTLDIKNAGSYQDDSISWSSLAKKHCDTTPSVTSNIYDLPFSTGKEARLPPIHYTPLISGHSSVVHSPASTRVSRVTSLPPSPSLTPRNNRHLYRQQTYLTQYQNL